MKSKSQSQASPLAIFFGDAHLDLGAWANRPALSMDSINAFKYICGYAIKYSIPYVIGAGDLIDVKKPAPEVVQFARTQLTALEAAGCEFHFIQGQHEYSPDVPWLCAIHSWPRWLNGKSIKVGSKTVYGLDWHSADKIVDAINSIPEAVDILVMHQVWEDFMGDIRGCEASFAQLPYAKTVFTGDYHVTKTLTAIGRDGQQLLAISPGSTNLRKIDEPVDKYFYVLYSDYTWVKTRIPTRRRIDLQILTEKDLAHFDDNFKSALSACYIENQKLKLTGSVAKPLCRVKYYDNIVGAYDQIKHSVGDTCELFLKQMPPQVEPAMAVDRANFKLSASNGLVGMLEAVLDKDDKLYQMLSRLVLADNDVKGELQRIKKERGLL